MDQLWQKKPTLFVIRVEVEPDDITHERAKAELIKKLGREVHRGMKINGIREPVYGLDENGSKVIVAYESVVWRYGDEPREVHERRARNGGSGMYIVESGIAIPI